MSTPAPALIVNYSHFVRANHESVNEGAVAELAATDPIAAGQLEFQLQRAFAQLQEEEHHRDVLTTPEDPCASALQTFIADQAEQQGKVVRGPSGTREVAMDDKDYAHWVRSFFTWWRSFDKAGWRPPPAHPEPLAPNARVAILGDWGSGLYGAPACARSIETDARKYDLIIHLGDIYYSGMVGEVEQRFLHYWPNRPDAVSRALNGNHEMYTGGHGYYDHVLPVFKQTSSVVWFENQHFVLVGLDTAYHGQFDLGDEQVDWLNRVVLGAGDRKIILMSHHQPYSLFETPKEPLVKQISKVFQGKPQSICAWYWGHEHRCVILDPLPAWNGTLLGRCVGHSGYPAFRDKFGGAQPVLVGNGAAFYRKENQKLKTSGLVQDGPNPFVAGHADHYAPNGFATLEFQGGRLTEAMYIAQGGAPVYSGRVS